MKILMISDTHGNMSMIDKMVSIAVNFDLTIHLGDNYPDMYLSLNQVSQ